jgi:RHS repeat-associated protein
MYTRDPNGNYTTYTYDAAGALAQEVQPVTDTTSITTSFGYDAAGNRTRYTDGRGNNWYTTYNRWGLKETEVEPATTAYSTAASCTTTYAYDADGRLTTQTLPGGVAQSFGYDVMGDLTSQQGSGASATTADRSFSYDKLGRMLTAGTSNTSGSGIANATSESFSYDDRGDLLTAGGSAGSTTLGYNGDGLLTSRADASGTSSYSYDPSDRLHTVTDALTGTTQTYTSYNKLNQVTAINLGSGDVRTFGYDDLHRLTSDQIHTSGGATVSSIGYGYDNNSNLTSKNTTGFGGTVNNTYTYDQADRLTSWNNGTNTTAYGYDAAGNRTQVGAKTFTYDARDQLTSDGTTGYTYTAAGTMSFQNSTALTSDAYGQQTTDGTIGYTYDALGRLTQRGLGTDSQPLQYSGTGNQLAADSGYLYSRDPGGNPLGVRTTTGDASTARLVITDQHTDVVATMSATDTTLTQTATYDPLGNPIGTRTAIGNLGYQSEYTDTTSGKVNMAARWYNPTTGQFTSKDTIHNNPTPNSAAANPFAYGNDDPFAGTDPTGHMYNNALGITPAKPAPKRATPKPKPTPARHMGRPEDRLDHGDPDGYVAYHNTTKKQIKQLRAANKDIEKHQRTKPTPAHHMSRPEDRLDHGDPDGYVAYHNTSKKQIQSLRDADNAIQISQKVSGEAETGHGAFTIINAIADGFGSETKKPKPPGGFFFGCALPDWACKWQKWLDRHSVVSGSACFMICIDATWQDGNLTIGPAFGVGVGLSASYGIVSAPSEKQAPQGWEVCIGDGLAACYVGGIGSDSAAGKPKSTWHGGTVGAGVGIYVGITRPWITFHHSIIPHFQNPLW